MDSLPQPFIQNLTVAFGRDKTVDWVARLPSLLSLAASRWDLEPGAPVDALSYNYVCHATMLPSPTRRGAGGKVILKIGIPNRELTSEIECLRAWGGLAIHPTVRLLAFDPENGLLLLERLRPGRDLASLADNERATEIAADVMSRLWIPAQDNPNFITLKGWFDELQNLRPRFGGGTGPFPARLLETAEGLLRDLFAEDERWLIHGDCHHYNILSHGDEWRVIDPKGVIGAREYEAAPFMLNPINQPRPEIKRETNRRLDIFSERLGLDRQRLWAWTVAHSVLSAWWDLQEDGTGGEFAIACGEAFLDIS
ncbi:MAG: phosphotransferase [Chloroflexi bacterium]|nr:phosphotransferase [Chloroflexota bacterium]